MWSLRKTLGGALGAVVVVGGPAVASAAELPAHDPLRILIIGDEVNPHGLSGDELTQPPDLGAAIGNPGSGLSIEVLEEVDSQCIDDGLAMLAGDGADVIVYFAHLAATACGGGPRQDELTAAMESHLRAGGGVVAFHHGIYEAGGKEGVLQLLGAQASSIAWDTGQGQDVIAVDGDHFVTTQAVEYAGMRSFSGAGVDAGDYPFFTNVPDERYDALAVLSAAGEERSILFASADGAGGSPRVLGYDLRRADWAGHVVFYQPGEYQPNALDLDGNNFQVLANAIYYVATTQDEPSETGGEDTGDPPGDSGSNVDDSGGSEAGGATSNGPGSDGTGTATGEPASDGGGEDGCGCRSTGRGGLVGVLGLLLGIVGRWRRG